MLWKATKDTIVTFYESFYNHLHYTSYKHKTFHHQPLSLSLFQSLSVSLFFQLMR